MLEIAAFTGVLTSLGGLIKVANESKNVEMTAKLIELQQKILEMQGDFGLRSSAVRVQTIEYAPSDVARIAPPDFDPKAHLHLKIAQLSSECQTRACRIGH